MERYYQPARIVEGKLQMDNQRLKDNISALPDGEYLFSLEYIPVERTPREWQKLYFHMRDILVVERDGWKTKETKEMMHEDIKEYVLSKIVQKPENIYPGSEGIVSTEVLSPIGWAMFIESLKIWAWSEMNVIL